LKKSIRLILLTSLAIIITILSICVSTVGASVPAPTMYTCIYSYDYANQQNIFTPRQVFPPGDIIYIHGSNFPFTPPYIMTSIFVTPDVTWTDGMDIPSGLVAASGPVSSDGETFCAVWNTPQPGKYDIIADINGNGKYDVGTDALIDNVVVTAGFFVLPEYPIAALLALISCFAAFVAFRRTKLSKNSIMK
jgi:hypothetical protein